MVTAPKRQWLRYLGATLVVVVLTIVGTTTVALAFVNSIFNTLPANQVHCTACLPPGPPGKPQTILLIGSDHRVVDGNGNRPRSDTLMLLHLGGGSQPNSVMSIPRDLKAMIPATKGMPAHYGKINEAFHDGGQDATVKVLQNILGITPNHVVVIGFDAFAKTVNKLGCLYQDIDQRYYNDNSQGGMPYAVINLQPGYQKLCGQDTLSWVRFRHLDSDFVRAARQQQFLRSVKGQVATSQLINNGPALIKIFKTYTQTDISGSAETIGLLKLAKNSASQPVRSIQFPGITSPDPTDTYVTANPAALAKAVKQFQAGSVPKTKGVTTPKTPSVKKAQAKAKKKATQLGLAPGLITAQKPSQGYDAFLLTTAFNAGFPVMYPTAQLALGSYATNTPARTYDITTNGKSTYPAYRLVIFAGIDGEYYGVQGTTWKNAPILKQPHKVTHRNGKTLLVYSAGGSYELVAIRTPKAVYWVANTVSLSLSNRQMLDIAASLKLVGT